VALALGLGGCGDSPTESGDATFSLRATTMSPDDLPDLSGDAVYGLGLGGGTWPPAVLMVELWKRGLDPVRGWQPVNDMCQNPLGPTFTVELAAPDARMAALGFTDYQGGLACAESVIEFSRSGADPAAGTQVGIDLEVESASGTQPFDVQATVTNAGTGDVFYSGLVCLPGVEITVVGQDGKIYLLHEPPALGCPSSESNLLEPAGSQTVEGEFTGELWVPAEHRTVDAEPGEYRIVATFMFRTGQDAANSVVIHDETTIVWGVVD
jgi:hypothetical protein